MYLSEEAARAAELREQLATTNAHQTTVSKKARLADRTRRS